MTNIRIHQAIKDHKKNQEKLLIAYDSTNLDAIADINADPAASNLLDVSLARKAGAERIYGKFSPQRWLDWCECVIEEGCGAGDISTILCFPKGAEPRQTAGNYPDSELSHAPAGADAATLQAIRREAMRGSLQALGHKAYARKAEVDEYIKFCKLYLDNELPNLFETDNYAPIFSNSDSIGLATMWIPPGKIKADHPGRFGLCWWFPDERLNLRTNLNSMLLRTECFGTYPGGGNGIGEVGNNDLPNTDTLANIRGLGVNPQVAHWDIIAKNITGDGGDEGPAKYAAAQEVGGAVATHLGTNKAEIELLLNMFGKYGATIPDFNDTAQRAITEVYRGKGPGYVQDVLQKVNKPIKLFDKQTANSQGTGAQSEFMDCNDANGNGGSLDLDIHQDTEDYLPARPLSLIFPLGEYELD